jgi:hypothetical protein
MSARHKNDIFISYSLKDQDWVSAFAAALKEAGVRLGSMRRKYGWTKDPMIPGEVSPGAGTRTASLLENDGGGSVTPGSFQTIQEAAIRQSRQTFRGHCRPCRISAQPLQMHTVACFDTDVRMQPVPLQVLARC